MNLHQHLQSRGLKNHRVDYDETEACFMLWTRTGKLVGVQYYNPEGDKKANRNGKKGVGKYVTKCSPGHTPIYGLESLDFDVPYCFVQEGIFDSLPILNLGHNCVAILTFNNPAAFQQLRLLFPRLYSIVDPDKSGERMARLVDDHIVCPDGDVGDMWKQSRVTELETLVNTLLQRNS